MTEAVAFVNANLFDGTGTVRPGATVVVEGGRIAGVGQGDAPSHARVIDLRGRTLMPGMTVGHWHGEYVNIGPPLFSSGRGGTALGTEEPPAILALNGVRALQAALMSGVTHIVSGSCANDLDWQLKLAIERGMFDGPHLIPCSRHVVTTGDYEDRGHWWVPNNGSIATDGVRRVGANVFVDGVAEIAKAVRQECLRGAEIIKILPTGGHGFAMTKGYRGLSRAELEMVVNTAHERGARVRAHVASAEGILECVAVGVDIIDHADEIDEACIEAMVKAGSVWVPSMLFTKMVSYGGDGEARPGKYADEVWDSLAGKLALASKAGVIIVPGDDFGAQGMEHEPGVYARELLVYADDMGIDAKEVLHWATLNGARLALDDHENGSIAAGKIADLIVIDGDPTKDISILTEPARYLHAVMLAGRLIKDELDSPRASDRGREGEPGIRLAPIVQMERAAE